MVALWRWGERGTATPSEELERGDGVDLWRFCGQHRVKIVGLAVVLVWFGGCGERGEEAGERFVMEGGLGVQERTYARRALWMEGCETVGKLGRDCGYVCVGGGMRECDVS